LEAEGELSLLVVLPRDNSVSLTRELLVVGNEAPVEDQENVGVLLANKARLVLVFVKFSDFRLMDLHLKRSILFVGYLKLLLVHIVVDFISMKVDGLIFFDVLYWLHAFTIYSSLFLCSNLQLRCIFS
jgi:hypothetical protein